jgi:hypothetical protein
LPYQQYEDDPDGTAARDKAVESRTIALKSPWRPILGARSKEILDSVARLLATPDSGRSQGMTQRGRVFERPDGRIWVSGDAFEQRALP